MPEQTPLPTDDVTAAEAMGPAAGKGPLLTKLAVLAFLAGVVAAECLLVSALLPSRAETAAMAGLATEPDSAAAPAPAEALPDAEETIPQVEVDLGEFGVTAYQPISNTTLRIDFHLYGTVATDDEAEFLAQLEGNIHRFRDQVIVTLRSSDITDLTDAGLGLIKRKILEKTNAMLGKRYLRAIIFSDFSFIEQ